jgi:hypothetical protein
MTRYQRRLMTIWVRTGVFCVLLFSAPLLMRAFSESPIPRAMLWWSGLLAFVTILGAVLRTVRLKEGAEHEKAEA